VSGLGLVAVYQKQCAFNALTWLGGRKGIRPVKKTEWWGAGMVVSLEQGADLHMAQLMPMPLTVSCFSKIKLGFTFLVPAHLGSPGQRAVKWMLPETTWLGGSMHSAEHHLVQMCLR